jgi:hypothetical protein
LRERVVTCEEVFELKIPLRDVASMQYRQPSLEGTGEVPLRRLVKEALRMRPSRIIVGEVRQAESLDLLIALNSGVPGMCTLHANSAREGGSSKGWGGPQASEQGPARPGGDCHGASSPRSSGPQRMIMASRRTVRPLTTPSTPSPTYSGSQPGSSRPADDAGRSAP